MKKQILLVEDDLELASLVKEYLERRDFEVNHLEHGDNAAEVAENTKPDLIILDLMLPGKDGITICKEIREKLSNPILMLTASEDAVDHVLGLEFGADDFVNKPIEPRILLARINALLRRAELTNIESELGASVSPDEIIAGEIKVNTSNRDVFLRGESIKLNTQEYDFVELLATKAGSVVSRDTIFQSLKGFEYDGQSRFVDILVSTIRNKLFDKEGEIIKTVRGKGYLLVK